MTNVLGVNDHCDIVEDLLKESRDKMTAQSMTWSLPRSFLLPAICFHLSEFLVSFRQGKEIRCVLILFTCLRLLCSCDRSCAWLFVKKYATLFVSIFCRFSVSFSLAWTPACLLAPSLAHSFVSLLLRFLLSKPWRCWEKEENNITLSPPKKGVIGDVSH